ncbi:MAG: glycosyltransferase [Candidatus Omnitrophota bacterium]
MATVCDQTQLLDYPFDLYQRTRDIREIVDIIASETANETPKLKILDVGGFRIEAEDRDNLLLREFLPQHDIVALDMVASPITGYVQGDGTCLPFKDAAFDVVVSSDVYEHIPPEDREKFLESLLRVSRGFVILGAPFYSDRNALAEQIVFEFVRKVLHSEHHQLKEHIENGLPHADELIRMIESKGLEFYYFESGNLDNWLVMMFLKHYLMSIPDTQRLDTLLDRFYNMSFYESDHVGNGYRNVFVIANNQSPHTGRMMKQINAHFTAYAEEPKHKRFDFSDMEHVRMLLDFEALRTRSQFEQKDALIQHLTAQVNALNRMRSTRVYRVMQGVNRLLLSPFTVTGRQLLGKLQQVGMVLSGKRRHPFLSISERAYRQWISKHEPTPEQLEELKTESTSFSYAPRISIVMPAYNTPQGFLEKAIESVLNQVYPDWELCVVDDGSSEKQVHETLRKYKDRDHRIRVERLGKNKGIARATNAAIAMATGEFIALMDSDDMLHPLALYEVVKLLNRHPEADFIFTDEDKLTLNGLRRRPEFKPGWDPELLLTYNYLNHLTVCRKQLLDAVGGFRAQYNWSQDYDLYLRLTEKTPHVFHIPNVLYHWREIPESSASKVDIRPMALAKSIELLTETLQRRGIHGTVKKGLRPGTFKIKKR